MCIQTNLFPPHDIVQIYLAILIICKHTVFCMSLKAGTQLVSDRGRGGIATFVILWVE